MTPDFDKIQAGMNNGLKKTQKIQKEETAQSIQQEAQNGLSFRGAKKADMGTGAAGRSSVKMDNFDTDMRKFQSKYHYAHAVNTYIDALVAQGYDYGDAVVAVMNELGNN
ncbi:hypothetical protein IJS77_03710 [bacterium]|nr:hypothetical protein [bacterium]